MLVQDKDYVQWPKPLKIDSKRRDPDKYCQFHRTHRHDTNDCYQLIHEIKRLVKRGHIQNFIKKMKWQRPQLRETKGRVMIQIKVPMNDGSSNTINMILGGTGGRMSQMGKKRRRIENENKMEVL